MHIIKGYTKDEMLVVRLLCLGWNGFSPVSSQKEIDYEENTA